MSVNDTQGIFPFHLRHAIECFTFPCPLHYHLVSLAVVETELGGVCCLNSVVLAVTTSSRNGYVEIVDCTWDTPVVTDVALQQANCLQKQALISKARGLTSSSN